MHWGTRIGKFWWTLTHLVKNNGRPPDSTSKENKAYNRLEAITKLITTYRRVTNLRLDVREIQA